jgi:hypothetical protein
MRLGSKRIIIDQNMNRNKLVGTSLTGYLNLNYEEIVSIFGKPNSKGDQYKVDWEWVFSLNDSPIAIYNYKTGPSYGCKGVKEKDIEHWHIGSKYGYDLQMLEDYIIQETGEKFSGRMLTRTNY